MSKSARPPARHRVLLRLVAAFITSLALACLIPRLAAQVPGKNVNLVAGDTWPDGDPFLQRQNEPSVAVSSRNILHLLAGANDYRTVDLPGLSSTKPSGDAWLGVFKSVDGGQTWKSTLLPGYPQDNSAVGQLSPLRGFSSGADATVRTGSNGLFYFSGIAFQRNVPVATNTAVDDGKEDGNGTGPGADRDQAKRKKERERKEQLERKEKTERKEKRERETRERAGTDMPSPVRALPEWEEAEAQGTVPAPQSAVFVSTFIDLNNNENGDPIRYVRTSIVDSDAGARFLDKQWTAVDIPRSNSSICTLDVPQEDGTVVHQTFPGGRVYVAYTAFTGPESAGKAQILLRYSTDCGVTWSGARDISTVPDPDPNDDGIVNLTDVGLVIASYGKKCGDPGFNAFVDFNKDCTINLIDLAFVARYYGRSFPTVRRVPQGANIAIHPLTGAVSIVWREFSSGGQPDVIQFARSTDFGATFSLPVTISGLNPFDQGTSTASFRTNGYPTIAAGSDRLYVAWASRGYATGRSSPTTGDSRIVMSTSTSGTTWSAPRVVDEPGRPGHQIMPALAFGAGKLSLLYYDFREDESGLFQQFVDETPILNDPTAQRRHTFDVWLAQADPSPAPAFTSVRLSEYAFGVLAGSTYVEQLTFNPPNLPMFRQGAVPFIGDYIDLAMSPTITLDANGAWVFNTAPSGDASGYAVWTDNRNVRPGPSGNLIDYTPPMSPSRGTTSLTDSTTPLPECAPTLTGTRNQDIFGARFDSGLFATAVGNSKQLGTVQRGFALLVENSTTVTRSFRLSIANQPPGGQASFRQFGAPFTVLDVSIPRLSTVARTLYATASDQMARVVVNVDEIAAPGGAVIDGGLRSAILINGDPSNPAIENPAIENPEIENKDIQAVEVYNPRINPAIENPAIENPAIENPAIENPAIENVTVANRSVIFASIPNPAIENPAIENPAIENPAIENLSLANGAITDTTWELTNGGNTTAVYGVKLLLNQTVPNGIFTQLIVHKPYTTPAAADCELKVQLHSNVLVNITSPSFAPQNPAAPAIENPAIENPAIENPEIENATIALAPGETVFVTVRVYDPDTTDRVTFEPAAAVTPAAVAQSVNSEDVIPGQPPPPPPASVSTTIAVPQLDDALFNGGLYGQQLYASVPGTWSIANGSLPLGVSLSPTGAITGTPTTPGTYTFTVQFTTSTVPPQTVTRTFTVTIAEPLTVVTSALPDGVTGFGYAASVNTLGGVAPLAWTISSGALPPGVTLDRATGALGGSPTASGTFTFTLQVVDSASTPNTASASYAISVIEPAGFERTWVGGDSNFSNPANWSPVGVPGPGDDVLMHGPAAIAVLSGNVTVRSLTLLNGAAIDTNGFTLTVLGNVEAGHTIHGTGTLVMTGANASLSGRVPNLHIAPGASVTLVGDVRVTGHLTLQGGVILAGYGLEVDGTLVVPGGLATVPGIIGTGGTVTVNGLFVAALVVDNAPLFVSDGSLTRFDNVQFQNFPPQVTRMTIAHPGQVGPVTFNNLVFLNEPTTGSYIAADDSVIDANQLTIHLVNAAAQNGPQHSVATNGAVIDWGGQLADLAVTKQESADPSAVNAPLTYTIGVTNNGPDTAVSVQVVDTLPASVSFMSASAGCAEAGGVVTCALGDLASGASGGAAITVQPTAAGMLTNSASAFSATPDPNQSNNVGMAQTSIVPVVGDVADLSVTKTHSPPAPVVGQPLTYTVTMTNSGPSAAHNATLIDTLPGDVTFVSASHAACQELGGQVTCLFGTLDSGASVGATITVTPTSATVITNAVNVGADELDPNLANNLAQDTVLVSPFAPCAHSTVVGPTFYPVGVPNVVNIATGDFNEDNRPDAAVTESSTNSVVIMLGDGAGGFSVSSSVPVGASPQGVVVADFNEDGHADLAVANSGAPAMSLLLGDGLGGFSATTISLPIAPFNFALADFNGDSNVDLVAGSNAGTSIAVLFGDGAGGFAAPTSITVGIQPVSVIARDYDGNGTVDIVAPDLSTSAIKLMSGNGLGGFAAPSTIASFTGTFLQRVRDLGDVNGDGRFDLGAQTAPAGTQASLYLVLNSASGFLAPVEIAHEIGAGVAGTGDFNGDGRLDIAVVAAATSSMHVMLGDGTGGFTLHSSLLIGTSQNALRIVDLNGDSRPDIVGTRPGTGTIYSILNVCGTGAIADLAITKSGPATAPVGTNVTYTITVTNHGPDASTAAVVTDVIPAGMSAVSIGSCTDTAGTLSCPVGPLAATASASFDVTLLAGTQGTRVNRVMVVTQDQDPDKSNNGATAATTITTAPLTFVVSNTNDSGAGSLRQAITDSNQNTGSTNAISFAIPGGGVKTVNVLSGLPLITVPVVLDGWTQGGAGYAGPPLIELNGAATAGVNGLALGAGSSGSTVRGLIINRFINNGLFVNSSNNIVEGNYIGVDATGTLARPNVAGIGVNGSNNLIGGTAAGTGNVIAGNSGNGIALNSGTNTRIFGNFIGTSAAGTGAVPNGQNGVFINGAASGNTIGGTTAAARNVIAGNNASINSNGVYIAGGSGNQVLGNFIGTEVTGTIALPNGGSGLRIEASNSNVVGGAASGARNVISGNASTGVWLASGSNNQIVGNLIGTDASGIAAVPNVGYGLRIDNVTGTTIGGTTATAANVLSGNTAVGIGIVGAGANNLIIGNKIGTDVTGSQALGNGSDGIAVNSTATANSIGGTNAGEGNIIAFNSRNGILINAGTRVAIRGNSIFGNAALGIDLNRNFPTDIGGDGPTANDAGDADTGPNDAQNTPIITSASQGSTVINGTLNGVANTLFAIDFFGSGTCDASGFGEGRRYLGSGNATTDGSGNVTFQVTLAAIAAVGEFITATATDPNGNTSEFSACGAQHAVTGVADLALTLSHTPTDLVVGQPVTYTVTTTNNGPSAATAVVVTTTLPASLSFTSANNAACANASGVITCSFPSLANGESVAVDIVATPTVSQVATVAASVSSAVADQVAGNNTASESALILPFAPCSTPVWAGPAYIPVNSSANTTLVFTADFDGDGRRDAAVSSSALAQIDIMLGDGAGGFAAPVAVPLAGSPTGLFVSDVNHDARPDLLVAIGTSLHVLLRNATGGAGAFTAAAGSPFATTVSGFSIEDGLFNADAHVDLVVGTTTGTVVGVLLGNGDGTFQPATTFPSGQNPINVIVRDFNGDGRDDIAVPNAGGTTISILNGNGNGTFAAPVALTIAGTVGRLRDVGDVNRDGWRDLGVTIASGSQGLLLLLSDQAGGFQAPIQLLGSINVGFVPPAADLDGDGHLDLVAAGFNTGRFHVIYGDGAGAFPRQADLLVGIGLNNHEVADLNGDQRPDIIATRAGGVVPGQLVVWYNTCGTSDTADLVVTQTGPATATAGDHLTYQITVTNNGPMPATGVVLTDVPSQGMMFESASIACTDQVNAVTCPLPVIPSGGSVTIDVDVKAFAAGSRFNFAQANGTQFDPDFNNNVSSQATTVGAGPVTFVVTTTNDSGPGSLRQAITDSNANGNPGSPNQITFNILPAGGVKTITPLTGLPNISVPVVIDGTTQPGWAVGAPVVELTGTNLGLTGNGLMVAATGAGSTIKGLVINHFGNAAINLNSGSNLVVGNFIGPQANGTVSASLPNGIGVLSNGPNNVIGGTTAGSGNLIAGNFSPGIQVNAGGTGTQIYGNLIGTNAAGAALGNGSDGIRINNASNVIVGSVGAGRNVISGNGNNGANAGTQGVLVNANNTHITGVQIVGNYIGVGPSGTAARPNHYGVGFSSGGGFTASGTVIEQNVISGNTQFGIHLGGTGATGTIITGNIVGLNVNQTAALGNTAGGIHVPAPNTVIGGTTAGTGNVIAGNTGPGISLITGAAGTQILGNTIGALAGGHTGAGIAISNVSNITIGSLTGTGRNVITSSQGSGISIGATTVSVTGIQIVNNYIGLAANGDTIRANGGQGVSVNPSVGFTASGTVIDRNVISGNTGAGVNIENSRATGTVITGNILGLDAAASVARGNGVQGVRVAGPNTVIGGTTAGSGNVIGGNANAGVFITSGSDGTQVFGNLIGTNASGAAGLGNGVLSGNRGVWIDNVSNVTVGSLAGSGRNVVVGSGGSGVFVGTSTAAMSGISVINNSVGLAPDGVTPLANNSAGVTLSSTSGFALTGTVVDRNVISGNTGQGVSLSAGVTGTTITGNLIGTDAAGAAGVANGSDGIRMTGAAGSVVGGTAAGAGNTIAFNSGNGITVTSGTDNAIRANSIHSNAGIGIDLGGGGSTANDAGDGDTGPNNFQNFPAITLALTGSTVVSGTLNSTPGTAFELDFYATPGACLPGQARRYLGSGTTLDTNGSGDVSFTFTLSAASTAGEFITATATDSNGNTSEISTGCQAVVGAPNLAVTTERSPASPIIGSPITYTLNVANTGSTAATSVTLVDTLPATLAFMTYTSSTATCANVSGVVTCNLGTIGAGASTSVDIVAQPTASQSITNSVTVGAAETDFDLSDNLSQDTALVAEYGVCSAMSFSGPFVYHTGGVTPITLATGDFNRDGFIDVVATEGADNTVAFMAGNGTGAFPAVTHIPAGTTPAGIASGDFDQDGRLDFVVSSSTSGTLNLVRGNGDGTFASPTGLALPFTPFAVTAQDLEPDGDLDLIAGPLSGGTTVAVRLNNGTGVFGLPTSYSAGSAPAAPAIGDFDANPGLDIAVANVGATTISILSGLGTGAFGLPSQITLPGAAQRVRAVGDVNSDGRQDLAVTVSVGGADNSLYLLVSNGSGGFQAPVEIIGPEGEGVTFVAGADLNKDGNLDLVASERDREWMLVLQGDGAGGFAPPLTYISHEIRNFFDLVDLNGDGRVDIAGTKGEEASVFVFLNTCASTTTADLSVTLLGPTSASAGDQAQYTIRVTNNGPSTVTNVVAQPGATDGFDFIGTSCNVSGNGEIACEAASLPSGGSVDFTFDLIVLSGMQTISASATASEGDPDPGNNYATLTVNVTPGPITLEVTNTDDGYGPGSLLRALEVSNNNPGGTNTIVFNIPGPGPHTIAVQEGLNIQVPVIIDGWSQGGPSYTGPPLIVINGANAPQFNSGLFIDAPNTTVRGLVINGFANSGAGISVGPNGSGAVIQGNYVGTNAAGTAAVPNQFGVTINAPGVTVGGASVAERNVISGSTGTGLSLGAWLNGSTVVSTGRDAVVQNNYIGLNAAGTAAIANANGIVMSAANVTILGNVIAGNTGSDVFVSAGTIFNTTTITTTPTNTLIQNNRVGTDAAGMVALSNVGVNSQGISVVAGNARILGNLVSGHNTNGINVGHQTVNIGGVQTYLTRSDGTVIQGNTIGLKADGTPLSNQTGIRVGAPNTIVGLEDNGTGTGNVVAGNTQQGINVTRGLVNGSPVSDGSGAKIRGNFIGIDAAGSAGLGNGGNGVSISDTSNVTVGAVGAGRNVIASNTHATNNVQGISVFAPNVPVTQIEIAGNYIGVAPNGSTARGNRSNGVSLSQSGSGTLSGTTIVGNTISGNGSNGINIGSGVAGTIVTGNFIGTTATGNAAVANANHGISLTGVSNTTIGGTTAAMRNILSGNGSYGISIGTTTGFGSVGNTILGNYIGTDASGTAAIPNGLSGVNLGTSGPATDGTIIGGSAAGAGNVISGNIGNGINIQSSSVLNTSIKGNIIGLNAEGTAVLPNRNSGIFSSGAGAMIGGLTTAEMNVLSGNGTATTAGFGLSIASGASGHTVAGNRIGTNAAGDTAMPNANGGISVTGSNHTIGGTTAAARNVISGNGTGFSTVANGIDLDSAATGVQILGNYIGVNAAGTAAIANNAVGVHVRGGGNFIGSTPGGAVAGNVISGNGIAPNAGYGITLAGPGNGNTIKGNTIGTDASGTSGILNSSGGIFVTGTNNNAIGGTNAGEGNTIAFHTAVGVTVSSGTGNAIRGNSIFNNTGPGIDLGFDGPTANDAGDGDTGANNRQNFPTLTAADTGGSTVNIDGTFSGASNALIAVDVFANATASCPSAGARYLGSTSFTTDGTGNASFAGTFAAAAADGEFITATATDSAGNTSEFSGCVTVGSGLPVVTVTATDANASEAGDTGTFTFTRTGSTASPLTVDYTIGGTAANTSDYTTIPTSVTIPATQSSATVTITPADDVASELAETVTLTVAGGASYVAGTPGAATVAIADNDTQLVSIEAVDTNAAEPGPDPGLFRFTRTGLITLPLTISYSVGGTAASGADYISISTALVFAAGQATFDRTVTPLNDPAVEGSETVVVTVNDGVNYDLGAVVDATVTIADQPIPVVIVETIDGSASEVGLDPGTIRFTRVGDTQFALNVSYTVTGTATAGSDYSSISTAVSIPAGQATVDRTVTPFNDPSVEGDETAIVTLADRAEYDPGATTSATVTIADQPVPIVTISIIDGAASEVGLDPGTIRFTRVGDTQFALSVNYTVTGTATAGSDYVSISTAVSIPAGLTTVDRTITPINDASVEGNETAIVTLADAAAYDLGATTSAPVTIADQPVPIVSISVIDDAASEVGLDPGTIRITRVGDTQFAMNVTYAVTGTATAGGDYSSISTAVSIPAGQTTVNRTIAPINDGSVEGNETVIVTLTDGAQYDLGATTSATVTIADQPAPVVTIGVIDGGASEVGLDPGTIRFTRVGDAQFALTVTYTVTGTATAGSDYSTISTSVAIPAGQTTVDRTVTPTNDGTVEGNETVIVTLVDGAHYDLGATTSATVTIADQPVPIVTVSAIDGAASEVGLDPGTVRFTRVGDTQFALTVTYTVTGTATVGSDYASISTSVAIPAGQTTVDRTVAPINDAIVEGNETVIVTLVDPASYDLGASTQATVTIADQPTPIVTVQALDPHASEASLEPGTFRFTRVGDTQFALTVTYTVTGSATAGSDYSSISTSVSIPAGQTTVDRTVTPLADAQAESTETVIVTLTDVAAYDLGASTAATVTIHDDVLATVVEIDASATEAGDPGSFQISRGAGSSTTADRDVTLLVTGTATNGTDYTFSGVAILQNNGSSIVVRIPAGQSSVTITATPADDAAAEGAETIVLTAESGPAATVTIADND